MRGGVRIRVSVAAWTELRAAVDAAGGDRIGLVAGGAIDLGGFIVERRADATDASPGRSQLARWFGRSPSAWLVLPRSLMGAMPDRWQAQMAGLLSELDATYDRSGLPMPSVTGRVANRFVAMPAWLTDWTSPRPREILARRRTSPGTVVQPRKSA